MRVSIFLRGAVIIMLFGAWACKSTSTVNTESNNTDSTSNREELYWARKDSAKMQFVEADVNFMIKMIGHHAQALIMSRMAPSHDASPAVQTLAARIINAQKDEIQTMQQWLRERNQPVPEIEIDGLQLHITGTGKYQVNHMDMAGMLSMEQLKELNNARSNEFDRLFLKYMIQHHTGALTMVDALISNEGAVREGRAFKLASDINVDQKTEIARMKRMLNRLTTNS